MNFFSQWPTLSFLRQDETRVLASEALEGKDYVVFFFGAPWDKKYNDFIPKMRDFYDKHHEAKKFEMILVTRGDTEEEILTDFYNPEFAPNEEKTFSLPCTRAMRQKRQQAQGKAQGKAQPPKESSFLDADGAEASKAQEAEEKKQAKQKNLEKEKSESSHAEDGEIEKFPSPLQIPRSGRHGNYLCLDPADSEPVGSPLLFYFRVWSYPGIVVCYNRPAVEKPTAVWPLTPRASPWQPAVVRPKVERDSNGRRKYTPMVKDRRCEPEFTTIAGKWMMERDPTGDLFPWDQTAVGAPGAAFFIGFVLFITVISSIFAVMVARDPVLKARVNGWVGKDIFY